MFVAPHMHRIRVRHLFSTMNGSRRGKWHPFS
jgi:hypothetical protein